MFMGLNMSNLEIKHAPLFNTDKIVAHYSEKDGVPIKYVCTTDLNASDVPVDVFYRDTPHPEFGNHYFGLYYDRVRDHMMITNADVVESYEFGMVPDRDGVLWYSQCHHDYIVVDGNMIDGGRKYIRSSGPVRVMKVKGGNFYDTSL